MVHRLKSSAPGVAQAERALAQGVRGAKTYKIEKKRCVFGQSDKFWKGHGGQVKGCGMGP